MIPLRCNVRDRGQDGLDLDVSKRTSGVGVAANLLSVCSGCGVEFVGKRPNQKWCSRECRDTRGGPDCYVCGLPTSRSGRGRAEVGRAEHNACWEHGTIGGYQKHGCRCDECRAASSAYYAGIRPSRARPDVPSCVGCGEPVFGSKIGSKYLPCHRECRDLVPDWKRRGQEPPWFAAFRRKQERLARGRSAGKRVFVQGPCAWCGEQFLASGGRYCSNHCKGAAGASRRGKFSVSPLVRAAIYERDRFLCHLCGRKVDVSLPGSNALGPTLDHVVRQVQGGTHDVDNLRLAHRKCNSIRRDLCVKDARAMLKRGVELAWLW